MKNKWRLSRTLSRNVVARPMEVDDLKYAWAAYKSGGLAEIGPPFDSRDMSAAEFRKAFEAAVQTRYHAWWAIVGHTRKGFIPIGIAIGNWAPDAVYMVIVGISWFPWASKRNIIEGTVKFFDALRKEMKWLGFASDRDKKIYEVCCMHGIMRRVGTTHMTAQPSAVFEGKN